MAVAIESKSAAGEARDGELLLAYAGRGDQAAFAEVVRRYVDFVHGSAVRQVRDASLADDVVQAVFIVLARRAGSVAGEHLPGWLLKTTRYCALDALKKRSRRERHEQRAAEMRRTTVQSTAGEASTEEIAGHLDAALAGLGAKESSAVALRYLGRKQLAEVAEAMGMSRDAVQKVIVRALPKLRRLLAARGVTLSSTAGLAAAMEQLGAHAAPAGMGAAVAGAVVSAGVSAASGTGVSIANGAVKLMWIAKVKTAAAVVAGVVVVGGGAGAIVAGWGPTGVVAAQGGGEPAASEATAKGEAMPTVMPFASPFLEMVNCRLVETVSLKLTATPDKAPQPVTITEQQFLRVKWDADDAVAGKAAAYEVVVLEAGTDDSDAANFTWHVTGLGKDARSAGYALGVEQLPAGATAKSTKALEPGDYVVQVYAYDDASKAGDRAKAIARATAPVTVKPLPNVQVMLEEFDTEGVIHFVNVNQSLNTDARPLKSGGFMNSDFVKITRMVDEKGREVKFQEQHVGKTFQYRYTLNEAVEPGRVVMGANEGTMTGLIATLPGGMRMYSMTHTPGGADTRRIEVYRLPAGAKLVSVTPESTQHQVVDGRVQLFVDKMIPAGGNTKLVVRYRLADGK